MTRPVWTWEPNWSTPVVERLLWMTSILPSNNATEERARIRANPRRELEFSTDATGHHAQQLDALLWGQQLEEWLIPLWWDVSRLDRELAAGEKSIYPPTANRDFRAGSDSWIVVLDPSTHRYHASSVVALGTDSIALDSGPAESWPKGSLVYPARIVHLDPDQATRHENAGVVTAGVKAEVVDLQAMTPSTDANGDGTTYNIANAPVFDRAPNWDGGIEGSVGRQADRVDFDVGKFSLKDRAGRPFVTRTHEYMLETRADLWSLRQWLEHCAGRLEEFWASTDEMNLSLTRPISDGDSSIYVRRLDYDDNYGGDQGRDHIAIRMSNGFMIYRGVTGGTIIDDKEERLDLDDIIDGDHPTDVKISWLERVRHAADAVEIQHRTAEVSIVALPFRTLRE